MENNCIKCGWGPNNLVPRDCDCIPNKGKKMPKLGRQQQKLVKELENMKKFTHGDQLQFHSAYVSGDVVLWQRASGTKENYSKVRHVINLIEDDKIKQRFVMHDSTVVEYEEIKEIIKRGIL